MSCPELNFVAAKSRVYLFFFCLLPVLLAACTTPKAVIDRSAMDKIFWPGPPEKPRISYLWSISLTSGGAGGRLSHFFGGSDDFTDPRESDRLLRPYGLFLYEEGVLFVTDTGACRISVIDLKTGDTRHIGKMGGEEFRSPIGVVAFRGKIYVSDSVLNKVFILDWEGRKTGEFQGAFLRPTSLAVDRKDGSIFVVDTLAHTIYRYDSDGKRVGSMGGNGLDKGEFNFPTHIWVDRKGWRHITDSMNFRIQSFSASDKFERMFGMPGDAYGDFEKPKGIAADSDGHIYVVDSIRDMIKIYDMDGNLLLFFGEQGLGFGQFWLPSGIFIDEKDFIYVADTYNSRIQVFKYIK